MIVGRFMSDVLEVPWDLSFLGEAFGSWEKSRERKGVQLPLAIISLPLLSLLKVITNIVFFK